MRRIFTTAAAILGIATANAQGIYYKLDNTFNTTGARTFAAPAGTAGARSGYLNDDGTMVMAGYGAGYNVVMKLKANGSYDSTLCGSYCTSPAAFASNPLGTFKVGGSKAGYYIAHEGYGGIALLNSAPTNIDFQIYSDFITDVKKACQFNDSTIVSVGGTLIFAYRPNAIGVGYTSGGHGGLITNCNYNGGTDNVTTWNQFNNVILTGVARSSDGKILVAGRAVESSTGNYFTIIAKRELNALRLDSTFGSNGIVAIPASGSNAAEVTCLEVASNGNIYLGIQDYVHAFSNNGNALTTFGTGGKLSISNMYIRDIIIKDNILYCASNSATSTTNQSAMLAYDATTGSRANVFYGWIKGEPPMVPYKGMKYIFEPSVDTFLTAGYTNFLANDIAMDAAGNIAYYGVVIEGGVEKAMVMKLKKYNVPTAIAQLASTTQLEVYPNPAQSTINIGKPTNKVVIYTMQGQEVLNTIGGSIDIQALPAGIYIAKMDQSVARFSKQ